MATYVPGKVVVVRDPSGYSQRQYQKGHWADARGNWVPAPTRRTPGRSVGGSTTYTVGGGSGGYQGLSDQQIMDQANAYADSQIAAKTAEIQRQEAAAQAAAQRDIATYQGLGQAQMGMISQIPANIQAIRDTAGQAIASFGGQVTDAQRGQAQAEQAANAAFTASQTGGTAAAAPDPTGVNAAGAAAAENAMGGTIPATSQAQIGAASAIAAAGMPAVVARATQEQIAQRMAQAAVTDADYRQQLVDAAASRGGIYQDALNNAYDLEAKKYGIYEAQQRLAMDQRDQDLKMQAELANEVAMGIKSKQQAAKDLRNYRLAQQRVQQGQQRIDATAAQNAAKAGRPNASLSRAYGYIVDSNGNAILDKNGNRQPVAKTGSGSGGYTQKQKASALSSATSKAMSIAKADSKLHIDTRSPGAAARGKVPTRDRQTAKKEIIAAITPSLKAAGYTPAQIAQVADQAIAQYYP